MEDQVLSIEQMQELIELGIDTYNASMCWAKCTKINSNKEWESYWHLQLNEESYGTKVPTFTLQDILEMLPNINGYYYPDLRQVTKLAWQVIYKPQLGNLPWFSKYGSTSIEAAFNMFKWCAENKYI